jgi:hypothetical protein
VSDITQDRREEVATLRDAARQLGVDRMRDESWFRRFVASHVKTHVSKNADLSWDARYPGLMAEDRATREIQRVARKVAVAGVLGSIGTSSGELLALVTDGIGAPIGLPAAVLSMALEGVYTSLVQIDLACDLASIYGVPFDGDDVGEVATLFGLALEVDVKKSRPVHDDSESEPKEARGLTAKLLELEDGDVAKRIGKKLIEDAIVRNVIPVLGIAVSGRWNYLATERLGRTVRKYVRYRRALIQGCSGLALHGVADPSLLVEGAWLLATADGDAGHEEVMALALILDQLPEEQRRRLELPAALGEDEEAWFERLARAPRAMLAPLLDVLFLIAATDREIQASERRFLRRVGRTVGKEVDFLRLERICRHLADGEELPPGTFGLKANDEAPVSVS